MRYLPLLLILAQPAVEARLASEERKVFLDQIRPEASAKAGQPVRFKVDVLNFEANWAVLVGSLMAEEGKRLDWSKAKDCDPSLDKMLWVVAKREELRWKVEEMSICASEPPYWYLEPKKAFSRPCGIYAGLQGLSSKTEEEQCRSYVSSRARSR